MWKQNIKATRTKNGQSKKISEQIIIEVPFEISLNKVLIHKSSSTPEHQTESAVGYLICHSLINSQKEIIKIDKTGHTINIHTIKKKPKTQPKRPPHSESLDIPSLMAQFQDKAALFKSTGTALSAALCNDTEILSFADDIHQNNAIYKVIGLNQNNDSPTPWHTMIIYDKITISVIQELLPLPIQTLVSRSGISNMALDLATENSIQCFGFTRGNEFTRY